jgi:hypothetical protein
MKSSLTSKIVFFIVLSLYGTFQTHGFQFVEASVSKFIVIQDLNK